MSLLRTIFKIPIKAQIAFLKLDASINENHRRSATITDNSIEDGSVVSDHVSLSPEELTITGHVSFDPISILGLGVSTDDFLGAADSFIDGDKSSFKDLIKNPRRTPKEAWDYLNEIMRQRVPFSVVTALQRYENMVITSLSAPREAKTGKDLIFTATLRKVEIVRSSVTIIPAFKTDSSSATSKSKNGKQSGQEANGAQTDNSSLLLKGFKKVGIF